MRKTLITLAPLALLALGACNNNADTPTAAATDSMTTEVAPMALPPSIVDSGAYRCADASVIYVDFYQGGTRAGIRTEQNGTATILNAPASPMDTPMDTVAAATPEVGATPEAAATTENAAKTLVADGGYALTGTGSNIKVTLPGKPEQTCKSS